MNLKKYTQTQGIRLMFWIFTAAALLMAICLPDRSDMFAGLARICTQSGQTVKSYFDPSYGGLAGTFLNLALVSLVATLLYYLPGAKPDGTSVLAFYLTVSFCFWGMTALNIWFSFAGVLLYCLVKKKRPGEMANVMLFSTGLAPLITELLFRYPGAQWHTWNAGGVLIALAVGLFLGFFLPAGLAHSPVMHKGYDLYSAAVPMGLMAFFLRALLYKVFGGTLPESEAVGLSDSFSLIAHGFCLLIFGIAVVLGILMGARGKSYRGLILDSGYGADYGTKYGIGTATLNFGVFGLFILLYYDVIGATWNAATLGCAIAMASTSFKGSHPRNVVPIMVGYVLMSYVAKWVCGLTGAEFSMAVNAQALVIGLCFASGLSPISGVYGVLAGVVAGMMHYILVTCVPLLHGSFLLYNGGFTAAMVCFLLVPVLEHFFPKRAAAKLVK